MYIFLIKNITIKYQIFHTKSAEFADKDNEIAGT